MPFPKDLRLSSDPEYLSLMREGRFKEAADLAQFLYKNVFGIDPTVDDSKAALPRYERAQFFDSPITEQGIKEQADLDKLRSLFGTKGTGQAMQTGLSMATGVAGAGEALPKAAKNFFAAFGLGDREEARPDAGATGHLQTGAEIGLNLLPFIGATKALSAYRGFGTLGAKLFGAGTKGAATIQTMATLGTAGGLTETARAVNTDIMQRLGITTHEPDYGEIPLAAVSFAAGGVPVNRVLAAVLQGGVSAGGQAAFKGEIDPQRVAMETIFAGVFGNPQFKDLRNQAVNMTPALADKIEQAHVTKNPRTRAQQVYKEGDTAKGAYIEDLAKQPDDVLDGMMSVAESTNNPDAARVIRDAQAEKRGDIVIHPEAPAKNTGTGVPRRTRPQRKLTNMQRITEALYESPEGMSAPHLAEALGLKLTSVQRAIRRLDNPQGEGVGTGILERVGTDQQRDMRKLYGLTKDAQGRYKKRPLPVHPEQQRPLDTVIQDEVETQMQEQQRVIDEPNTPPQRRQAAEGEVLRLSKMLEDVSGDVDHTKLTQAQADALVRDSLEGRTKGEIEDMIRDASVMPDQLKSFRRAVIEESGKMFRKFPEDQLLKAQQEAIAEVSGVDQPKVRFTSDIPKDIDNLRNVGAMWDYMILPKDKGFEVYRHGRKRMGKEGPVTLDEAHELINMVAQGKAVKDKKYSIETAALAARNKGWRAKHIGNDNWKVDNPETNEVQMFDNQSDAFDFINQLDESFDVTSDRTDRTMSQGDTAPPHTGETLEGVPTIEDNAVLQEPVVPDELPTGTRVAGTRATIADDPAYSTLMPAELDTKVYGKGEKDPNIPNWFAQNFKPLPDLMQKYSDQLGVDLFNNAWVPVYRASQQRDAWSKPLLERLGNIHKGVPRHRYHVVHQMMMAKDMKNMAVKLDATPKELEAGLAMRDWYKDTLDMDTKELHNFLHEGLPKIRAVKGALHGLDDYTLPGAMAELMDDIDKGWLHLHDDSSLGVALDTLHALGRKRYMEEPMAQAKAMESDLHDRAKKDPVKRDLYNGATEVMRKFMDASNNYTPNDAAAFAEAHQHWAKALKKLRLIEGEVLRPQDVERIAMMSTSWYGGLAMSFRAALSVRNSFQPFLAAPKIGFEHASKGYKDAIWVGAENLKASAQQRTMSPTGTAWRELYEEGIINQPAMMNFAQSRASRTGGGLIQGQGPVSSLLEQTEGFLRGIQSTGLVTYRTADQLNRASTYFGGKRALTENWKLYQNKKIDIDTFYVDSGLAGDSRVIRKEVMQRLAKGQVEEAAKYYGGHVSRTTQYLYQRANVPQAFQGVFARIAGQFGVWPMGFHSYISSNAGGFTGMGKGLVEAGEQGARSMLSPFGVQQRARGIKSRYRQKFATRMAGKWAALALLGTAIGIDTSTWNKANPFGFFGGPGMQLLRDNITVLLQTGSEFERDMALSSILRMMKQTVNPVSAAWKDWEDAIEQYKQNNDLRALLEALGFNTTD